MSSNKTVYLHIGHPKTGSSAFQSIVAKFSDHLALSNILYPELISLSAARRGHISSGNIPLFNDNENWFLSYVLPAIGNNKNDYSLLFSNESLVHRMDDFFQGLQTFDSTSVNFNILLVVRNPLEHLSSVYQQLVKRHGYCKTFAEHLCEVGYCSKALMRSAQVICELLRFGIPFRVFNYSVLRSGITAALFSEMDVDYSSFPIGSVLTVNRSLSRDELRLLLLINSVFGRDVGRRLSDDLVNHLPDIVGDAIAIPDDMVSSIVSVNRSYVETVNYHLPIDQQLTFDSPANAFPQVPFSFTDEQLAICRNVLGSRPLSDQRFEDLLGHSLRLVNLQSRLFSDRSTNA